MMVKISWNSPHTSGSVLAISTYALNTLEFIWSISLLVFHPDITCFLFRTKTEMCPFKWALSELRISPGD